VASSFYFSPPCLLLLSLFLFTPPPPPPPPSLPLPDALPISVPVPQPPRSDPPRAARATSSIEIARSETRTPHSRIRVSAESRVKSEEHTSELQSRFDLVCRLLLEKKK